MPLQWQSRSCDFSFCPFGHIPFKSPRLVMRDNLLYATANLETTGLKLFFLEAPTLEVRLPAIYQSGSDLGRRASCPTIFEATMPPLPFSASEPVGLPPASP